METDAKRILFASDLSEHAKTVFRYAASLAGLYDASIVILHVMETAPYFSEEKIANAIGGNLYQEIKSHKKETARNILINKNKDALRIQGRLSEMHQIKDADLKNLSQRIKIEDVIVTEGDIAGEILSTCVDRDCDLIVMGYSHRGKLTDKLFNSVAINVLKQSRKPVFLLPIYK